MNGPASAANNHAIRSSRAAGTRVAATIALTFLAALADRRAGIRSRNRIRRGTDRAWWRARPTATQRRADSTCSRSPGTPDASPQTQITFPSLAPSHLKAIAVKGSRSGPHAGRWISLQGGHGTAFLPDRPFTNGEQVSVTATLSSPAAGTAVGAPNASRISFGFAIIAPLYSASAARAQTAVRHDIRDSDGYHAHVPLDQLDPSPARDERLGPIPIPLRATSSATPRTPSRPARSSSTRRATWLYFNPLGQQAAYDVAVQSYEGQQVLTYWQGYASHYGVGQDVILDHHYHVVKTVNAANGYRADEHEFLDHPAGQRVHLDLRAGASRSVLDRRPQERHTARLDHPGDPHLHRPAAVGVACLRPRPHRRELRRQADHGPVRLLPHQLDPAAAERKPARVRPPDLDRVRDQHADRQDPVQLRRQAFELPSWVGSQLRVAARRRNAAQRPRSRCSTTAPATTAASHSRAPCASASTTGPGR